MPANSSQPTTQIPGRSKKQSDDTSFAKPEGFFNWSGGVMRKVSFKTLSGMKASVLYSNPWIGTYRNALNMESDEDTGMLVSRLGTALVGAQRSAGYACLGIGNYNRTQSAANKLFAAFPTASDNTVFDMISGTASLTGDTKGLKTRFCSFLDEIVRVNGTDACKSYNNSSWITTGGAFDLANMPKFDKVIEWNERIFGALPNSDKLSYSSIADPAARTISWTDSTPTTGAGNILISQEDGGGGIQALSKVPGYLLIFKQRTLKRWDGSTTFPEDLVNQGVPYQECVCTARSVAYFINQKGIWTTSGSYPVRISRSVQDFVDAIPDWTKVSVVADDVHVLFSIGQITIGLETFSNVVIKYNIEDQTWNIRTYYNNIQSLGQYVDSNGKVWSVAGDDNGQTLILDSGLTDYPSKSIPWTVEPAYLDWGVLGNIKQVQKMNVYTENTSIGQVLWRNNNQGSSYKPLGKITGNYSELKNSVEQVSGNKIGLKFTGVASTERVKFVGYEFPPQGVIITQNTSE